MGKGLRRSLGGVAANPQAQTVVKMTVPVRAVAVTVNGATGIGFGTAVIGDLPEGNILLLGSVANLNFVGSGTGHVATFNGDFSIGSAPNADTALAGAEVDIVPSTAVGPAVANVAPQARGVLGTPLMLDNTDGSLELNLNVLIDDADISANGVIFTVTGAVTLLFAVMLDD
jgi:hypothetical protein